MARGHAQRVESATVEGEGQDARGLFSFSLPLKPFVDGGWYWYDVVAGDHGATVEGAEWTAQVPADRAEHGTVDVCITTMLPDMCAQLLGQLGDAEELQPYLDTVMVMDQGKDKVTDSEYFPAAEAGLGDKLRVIVQGNLGGSGGYARGQLESVRKGTATYAMMMDDDVVCEPEGIIRAVTFGDLAKRPTIVGGHMFNLYSRSAAPLVRRDRAAVALLVADPPRRLQPVGLRRPQPALLALAAQARRRRLQRLVHVPDPAGRARGGRPVAAGLHQVGRLRVRPARQGRPATRRCPSRAPRSGTCRGPTRTTASTGSPTSTTATGSSPRCCTRPTSAAAGWCARASTTRSSTSRRCSTPPRSCATSRWRTCCGGPHALHGELATKLAEINAFRKQFSDAQLHTDRDDLPPVRRKKPPQEGQVRHRDPRSHGARCSAPASRRCASCARCARWREDYPEAELTAMDAGWFNLAKYDSAVVSMNDGIVGRALQARPGPLPRPAQAHDRDPPALPARVAGPGPAVPRRPRRDHLPRGVGEDLRALDRPGGPPCGDPRRRSGEQDRVSRP